MNGKIRHFKNPLRLNFFKYVGVGFFSPKTIVIEKSLEAMKSMGMGKEVV